MNPRSGVSKASLAACLAAILLHIDVARAQVHEAPAATRQVECKSPDGVQVLAIDSDKSTMALRTGDVARWTAALDSKALTWPRYWVSNRGWVVVASGLDTINVYEPEKGAQVWSLSLLNEFTRHGWSKYVHRDKDRPPQWEEHALWAFREVHGAHCFVVRPWWGDRIIIDLQGKRLLDDADEAREEIVKQESEWVLATLREAAAKPCPEEKSHNGWELVHQARMAAHLAGQLKVEGAAEFLQILEKWDFKEKFTGPANSVAEGGKLNPLRYRVNTLRQATQLSLRRLGTPPVEGAPISFEVFQPDRQGEDRLERIVFARPDLPRPAGAKSVRVGMTPQDVGKLLGGPDGVVDGAWEFDIEEGGAKTFRVTWKDAKVSKVERIPPRWHAGTARDEEFLY